MRRDEYGYEPSGRTPTFEAFDGTIEHKLQQEQLIGTGNIDGPRYGAKIAEIKAWLRAKQQQFTSTRIEMMTTTAEPTAEDIELAKQIRLRREQLAPIRETCLAVAEFLDGIAYVTAYGDELHCKSAWYFGWATPKHVPSQTVDVSPWEFVPRTLREQADRLIKAAYRIEERAKELESQS